MTFRRRGRVDLAFRVRFIEPCRDAGGSVALAGCVGALGDGDWVISHAFHHANNVLGVLFTEDVNTEGIRVASVFLEFIR